MQLQWN